MASAVLTTRNLNSAIHFIYQMERILLATGDIGSLVDHLHVIASSKKPHTKHDRIMKKQGSDVHGRGRIVPRVSILALLVKVGLNHPNQSLKDDNLMTRDENIRRKLLVHSNEGRTL